MPFNRYYSVSVLVAVPAEKYGIAFYGVEDGDLLVFLTFLPWELAARKYVFVAKSNRHSFPFAIESAPSVGTDNDALSMATAPAPLVPTSDTEVI